jgi:D-alanine-D-alanine ligase
MLTVGVLFGGRSGEHDVSLCSAASVITALDPVKYHAVAIGVDRDGRWYVQDSPVIVDDRDFGKILQLNKTGTWSVNHYENGGRLCLHEAVSGKRVFIDVVFPALHGTFCEDGTLQGLLELAMVPYVGADVLGSSVGMDKDVSKRLLRDAGIPVVPWITITPGRWANDRNSCLAAIKEFGFPVFVKPANAGSSVGVRKSKNADDLAHDVEYAFQYDSKVLIEKSVRAREIECAVLGNENPEASVLGEVIPNHDFYSYEAKYIDPDGARLEIPAKIDSGLALKIRAEAVRAYETLNCSGMARVDFFLDRETGAFFLNEINTLPGFTRISMYPKLWRETGVDYPHLLERLIGLALERYEKKMKLKREK